MIRSLIQSLRDFESIKAKSPNQKSLIYQKYILRCLTSCMRNQRIILSFLSDEDNLEVIIKIIKTVKDEEILANANKILRILFRDDHGVHEMMVENKKTKKDQYNDPGVYLGLNETVLSHVINSILEEINVHDFSEIVLVEATAAILNFVKKPSLVKFIIPQNISYLINIVMENFEKPRVLAIQSLQLMAEHSEYKKYIQQLGAEDILDINV